MDLWDEDFDDESDDEEDEDGEDYDVKNADSVPVGDDQQPETVVPQQRRRKITPVKRCSSVMLKGVKDDGTPCKKKPHPVQYPPEDMPIEPNGLHSQ